MVDVTLYHNPRCTKSRQALQIAEGAGPSQHVSVVRYLDHPLTADELRDVLSKLEDEPSKLVRKDRWDELGVTTADAATTGGIVDVLVKHPELMERPLLVTPDRAFIGRPIERVTGFFGASTAR